MPAPARRSRTTSGSFKARVVMCAVDFSQNAGQALRLAAELASRTGARLVLGHVHDPLLAAAAATQGFDLNADTTAELRKLMARYLPEAESWPQPPPSVTVTSPAAAGVIELARISRADVVVMGTHGLSGYRKAFFGSTTDRVMRQIDVPLIAVPPRAPRRSKNLLGGGPVVVAVDFSAASREAVRLGAALAETLGVEVALVHVIEPPGVLARWRERLAADESDREATAAAELQRVAVRLKRPGTEAHLQRGSVPETTAAFARRRRASLIAVGAHRGGQHLSRAIGSTAYRIACLSNVPLLVVPSVSGKRLPRRHVAPR